MKPYVNFTEFEDPKRKKLHLAYQLLKVHLFPEKYNEKTKGFSWQDWESIIIDTVGLKGKDKALFLGHSARWAGTSLT